MKEIAIIGGGPAGLGALQVFTETGFNCTLYECSKKIGGTWGDEGSAWPDMPTNLSKGMLGFLNFYWEIDSGQKNIGDYPTKKDVGEYLYAFVEHFGLKKYIQTNSEVIYIKKENEKW